MAKNNFGVFNSEKEMKKYGLINTLDSKTKSKKRDKQPSHLKPATRQRWWGNKLLGECFCCGRKLHYDDAEVGHIQAASKGGKWAPDNCRLICRKPCNAGMGNTNMKVYMKKYYPERYEKFFGRDEPKQPIRRNLKTPKQPKQPKPQELFEIGDFKLPNDFR